MLARSALLVILLSCAVFAQMEKTVSIGSRVPNDRKITKSTFMSPKDSGMLTGPLDTYRTMNAGKGISRITELTISIDSNANCASVVPINGGPGSTFVVLHFRASAGCNPDVSVDMYGI